MTEDITTQINFCARCGYSHPMILLKEFQNPVEITEEIIFTHWAMCPNTGEPIMVKISQTA